VNGEVLMRPCPLCGEGALAGDAGTYACSSCGTRVGQRRWLSLWPRDSFFFQAIGQDYRNLEADLAERPFSVAQLAALAGTCYRDSQLEAIADGDLSHVRPPASTVAGIMFPQTHETCYIQVNGLTRAEGPPLPQGSQYTPQPVDRRTLRRLDRGNLFLSDQRLIFPSSTHTTIRIDRRLSGVHAFRDALAVQRQGEAQATYFLDMEPRHVSLVAAYLCGRLEHLRSITA
jgi:hypothetical protein